MVSATSSDRRDSLAIIDIIDRACCSVTRQGLASLRIYGDTKSGNCLKAKWVCDHLALPYSWIAIDILKQETRSATFLELNRAAQVPVVEFEDGRTLAQSNAIIRYLARQRPHSFGSACRGQDG